MAYDRAESFILDNGEVIEAGHVYILHMEDGREHWVSWTGELIQISKSQDKVPLFLAMRDSPAGMVKNIVSVELVI